MTTIAQLRARAQRYRELSAGYGDDTGAAMRGAADELERQANALEAYEAAARLTERPRLTISI